MSWNTFRFVASAVGGGIALGFGMSGDPIGFLGFVFAALWQWDDVQRKAAA